MLAPSSQFDLNGTMDIRHLCFQLLVRCLGLSYVLVFVHLPNAGLMTMYTTGSNLHSCMRSSSIQGETFNYIIISLNTMRLPASLLTLAVLTVEWAIISSARRTGNTNNNNLNDGVVNYLGKLVPVVTDTILHKVGGSAIGADMKRHPFLLAQGHILYGLLSFIFLRIQVLKRRAVIFQ